jgi:hypothetical protein
MAKAEQNGKFIPTTAEKRALHGTVAEAHAARPTQRGGWRLYTVTSPDGSTRYVWAGNVRMAAHFVVQADGYKLGDSGRAPSKDRVASMLAALTAEDRNALLAQYKRGK